MILPFEKEIILSEKGMLFADAIASDLFLN